MTELESRLFELLKDECTASSTGEIITKVEILRQQLGDGDEEIYPCIVSLRNKGLISTHKKGRLGMTVKVLREEEEMPAVVVNYCPNCGRKVPTLKHRFCYNCGESLNQIMK
jgi:hypothetical protein